jgi:hypothetical protein
MRGTPQKAHLPFLDQLRGTGHYFFGRVQASIS